MHTADPFMRPMSGGEGATLLKGAVTEESILIIVGRKKCLKLFQPTMSSHTNQVIFQNLKKRKFYRFDRRKGT